MLFAIVLAALVHTQTIWESGCDFDGNDFQQISIGAEQCGPTCQSTNQCTHFAWFQGVCYLKSGPVSFQNRIKSTKLGIICGTIQNSSNSTLPNWLPPFRGKQLVIRNNCPYEIFPAFVGTNSKTGQPFWGRADSPNPSGTKTPLNPQSHLILPVNDEASSVRVWARQGCTTTNGKFKCDIGECGNILNNWDGSCYKSSGEGGISLAEFTFNKNTFYDLSLVDGYTIPIAIKLYGQYKKTPNVVDEFNCGQPTCSPKQDFSQCPPELIKYSKGKAIGCWNIHTAAADIEMRQGPFGEYLSSIWNDPELWSRTACDALTGNCGGNNVQETFYSGNHLKRGNRLQRQGGDRTGYACSPYIDWMNERKDLFEPFICYDEKKPKPLHGFGDGKSYSEIFKSICKYAYSWQFNDGESTFQCSGDDVAYVVEFC